MSLDMSGAFFLPQIKRPLTNNVESGYLTLIKTNPGYTHQGIEGCGWSCVFDAPVRANSGKMTLRLEGRVFIRSFL